MSERIALASNWQAIEFLKLIPEKGCIPNSTTYNIIVGELLKAGETQVALDLLWA